MSEERSPQGWRERLTGDPHIRGTLGPDAVAGVPGAIASVPDGMASAVLVGVTPCTGWTRAWRARSAEV